VKWLSTLSKLCPYDILAYQQLTLHRYEQLQLRANALREELHTEIERMLDDIVRFKLHVQKNLEDYEQFIADEVERSCEEQDLLAQGEEEEMADES
jgi:kinetochore protein NDC80